MRPSRVLIVGIFAMLLGAVGLVEATFNGAAVNGWFAGNSGNGQGAYTGPLLAMQAPEHVSARTPHPAVSKPAPATSRSSPSPSTVKPTRSSTPTPSTKPKPKTTATHTTAPASSAIVNQLLAQINALRAANHLPPYTLLSGLVASAHKHNLKMMGTCGMSHQCPGEASLGDRISAEGVHWSSCGENVGWSGPNANTSSAIIAAAKGLTTAMYNEKPPDDGHRLNLLSTSFHRIGIDVVRDPSGKVWLTQDFSS